MARVQLPRRNLKQDLLDASALDAILRVCLEDERQHGCGRSHASDHEVEGYVVAQEHDLWITQPLTQQQQTALGLHQMGGLAVLGVGHADRLRCLSALPDQVRLKVEGDVAHAQASAATASVGVGAAILVSGS